MKTGAFLHLRYAVLKTGRKKPRVKTRGFSECLNIRSHSAGDLTRTEASGADIGVSGSAIHDCLNTLDIGLHSTVGTTVRVRHLDGERNALVAEFTFGHVVYLLAMSK